jgi:hypothetical protein
LTDTYDERRVAGGSSSQRSVLESPKSTMRTTSGTDAGVAHAVLENADEGMDAAPIARTR